MKPSDISVQKVVLEAHNGIPEYNTCCTECRHAQSWLLHKGLLVVKNGVVKFSPETNPTLN